MSPPVLTASGLRIEYPDGRVVAIGGLPFEVRSGERVALVGPNGSGKSTLLRTLLGLIRPAAGEARVFGRDPAREFDHIRPRLGVVLQDVDAQLLAPMVGEDVAFGLAGRGLTAQEMDERVRRIAERFEITHLLDKVPHYLSGGERRKVALAGALVTEPDLLVLDEPFAGLDPRSRAELMDLIGEEHARRGLTLVLTTHEIEELPGRIDTMYVIGEDGTIVARGTPAEIFAQHDVLVASNVRPPQLVQLYAALAARGIDLPLATSPEEVADLLLAQYQLQRDRVGV
jgi:cobalt/nickel transport system ATP-binding protein